MQSGKLKYKKLEATQPRIKNIYLVKSNEGRRGGGALIKFLPLKRKTYLREGAK